MKKILILISIFAVLSLAAEIPCDDVLRMADTSGVVIMPKTFDAMQGGGVDTTELLAATEALDDDLLVLHMGQGKANLKKEEA